jgi:hypothetical protein
MISKTISSAAALKNKTRKKRKISGFDLYILFNRIMKNITQHFKISSIPMDLKHLLEEVHPLEQRNNSTAPTLQSADFRVEIGRKDKRLLCNVISQHFLQLRCVLSPLRIHVNVLDIFRCFLKRCLQDTVASPLRLRSDPFPLIKSMFALHSAGNGLLKAAVVRVGNVATEFLILQLQR